MFFFLLYIFLRQRILSICVFVIDIIVLHLLQTDIIDTMNILIVGKFYVFII